MIRICTWNLWHGLNPYNPSWLPSIAPPMMLPMETPWGRVRRRERQIEELRALRSRRDTARTLDVFCLQEVSPFAKRMALLARRLGFVAGGCLVNSGIKVGTIGFPPLLMEGIATFHSPQLSDAKGSECLLSGSGFEWHGPMGSLVSVQTSERRKAYLVEGRFQGRQVAIVNLHLHHGPDSVPENLKRKRSEIKALIEWLAPTLESAGFVAIAGDFNCDPDSRAVELLHQHGFESASRLDRHASVGPTWDPENNRLAALSPEGTRDKKIQAWDSTPHEFDRIYLRKDDFRRVRVSRVMETGLSDHFGVLAEVQL